MKTKNILLVLGIVFLCGCNDDEISTQTKIKPTAINFTEIGRGVLFGNGQEGIPSSNVVITNNTLWQNLISQMDAVNEVSDSFTEIDINFNQFTVFAIFLEVKPNGSEVEIQNVIENENSINITKEETELAITVITQPFHIIKIPKTNKPIIVE